MVRLYECSWQLPPLSGLVPAAGVPIDHDRYHDPDSGCTVDNRLRDRLVPAAVLARPGLGKRRFSPRSNEAFPTNRFYCSQTLKFHHAHRI